MRLWSLGHPEQQAGVQRRQKQRLQRLYRQHLHALAEALKCAMTVETRDDCDGARQLRLGLHHQQTEPQRGLLHPRGPGGFRQESSPLRTHATCRLRRLIPRIRREIKSLLTIYQVRT